MIQWFQIFDKRLRERNFIFFWQTDTLALETSTRNKLRNNSRGYQMSSGPKKRTCPIFTLPLFSFFLSSLFRSFLFAFFFLSPLLPRFRFEDILLVPIVKHPHRRYAIVAFWVAWEPERADSGMRPGILTCWTFVVELPTSLCPRCVHVQRRDRATSFAKHNRAGGPLAFMNLSRTWTPI